MAISTDTRDRLRRVYLFSSLTDEQLERLLGSTRRVELREGKPLFSQGDPADRFYLVEQGQIKLYRLSPDGGEKVIEVIGPGQTFAEAVMFMEGQRYPVNSQAIADTVLLGVENQAFRAILGESTETCFRLMADMSMRLHHHVSEIDNLTLHNATFRLVRYLLTQLPSGAQESPMIRLTTPKHIIASRLSIQPETFSRILGRLEQKGLIKVEGGDIVLVDLHALRMIVEF